MLHLKLCKKCHGDMLMDKDHYGTFLFCLQCGRYQDLDSRLDVLEKAARALPLERVA